MTVGIIPARFASTRFPGKLLADLHGKPVLQWTWERASAAKLLDRLVIAAADRKIYDAAKAFGADVVEVFDDVPSGSDRIWRAAERMRNAECGMRNAEYRRQKGTQSSADIVVNIQGDEPLLDPATIDAVVEKLQSDPDAGVATAAAPITDEKDYRDPSCVKVVLDVCECALYFSRSPVPFGWTQISAFRIPHSAIVFRHIGLYAYRWNVLRDFVAWQPSPLELTEKLEQLRLLYHGVKVVCAVVPEAGMAVDTEGDLLFLRENLQSASR